MSTTEGFQLRQREALVAKIAAELQSKDLPRILTALAAHEHHFSVDATFLPFLEFAAAHLYLGWLNREISNDIHQVIYGLSLIQRAAGPSELIAVTYGLALFEAGDLSLAEFALDHVVDRAALPVLFQELRAKAIEQLRDAKAVNVDPYPSSTLLLLDTAFPSKSSSFRYGEFSSYLRHVEGSVYASRPDQNMFAGTAGPFPQQISSFVTEIGIQAARLRRFDRLKTGHAKAAYCIFLNIADTFFNQIGIPEADHLVFTLYPGGGFAMRNPASDMKLRKLFDNARLSKVITTQKTTYDYLVDNGFCDSDRIEHIFGVVVPAAFEPLPLPRRVLDGSRPINVCFVAHRYSAFGAEKGYDVFASVVRALANSPDFNFHVVGGFDRFIIDLGDAENIQFHGPKPADFFPVFYASMDAILSPAIQMSDLDPNVPAYFDGFPTTCVVEAGLQGVAMFATDLMRMNQCLDGTPIFDADEIEIIDRNPEAIVASLQRYATDRVSLTALGARGRNALLREFSFERQMAPRIALLNSYLND